jgi:hypothetical protein
MTRDQLIDAIRHIEDMTSEDSPAEYACQDLRERLTTDAPNVTYNDKFDRQHYPLAEWHYDMIQEISEIMGLPPTLDWVYMATIHGKCFQAKISPMHARHCSRIHAMQMKQLIDLPGFRWIETGDGDTIDIGIEHDEAVAKQKHAISAARG